MDVIGHLVVIVMTPECPLDWQILSRASLLVPLPI